MKKLVVSVIAMAMTALIVFAGCATPSTPSTQKTAEGFGPTAGVAQKPDGSPYHFADCTCFLYTDWCITGNEVMKTLVRRAGGIAETYDPKFDLDVQVGMVEDLMTRDDLDAITLLPTDSAALGPLTDKALASGLPVFNFEQKIASEKWITLSTTDTFSVGNTLGQWFADKASDGQQYVVYEIWGAYGHEGAQNRHAGFRAAIDPLPNVEVIESPDSSWAIENAMQFTVEATSAHPEINAIFDMGSMMTGVLEGLKSTDKLNPVGDPNHIILMACDEPPATLNGVKDGYVDAVATHSPWEEMDLLVKAMLLNICCGQSVPKEVILDSVTITKDNADEARWGAPLAWGLMFEQTPNFDEWPELNPPPEDVGGLVIPTVDMKEKGY